MEENEEEKDQEDEDMVLCKGDVMRISVDPDMEERLRSMSARAGKRRIDWETDVERMNKALEKENIDCAIVEIYSPPRVNAIAELWGLLPGWSLDLTTIDPDDGMPWDFSIQDKRDKAEQMVRDKTGLLLIGSPMCSAVSQLQALNRGRMGEQKYQDMVQKGTEHLEF